MINIHFNRMESNERPEVFVKLPLWSYIYNHDIQEFDSVDEEGNQVKKYSFVSVQLKGYPNVNAILQALFKSLISTDAELKLINDYNTEVLSGNTIAEDNPYITYLRLRQSTKEKVLNDFKSINNGKAQQVEQE